MARNRDKEAQRRVNEDARKPGAKGVRVKTRTRPEDSGVAGLDASTLSRRLFEEFNPVRALELAVAYYTRSPIGSTSIRIWLRNEDRAIVRIPRVKNASRPQCLATLAFFRDAVQMATGSKVEASEERCVMRGDASCMHQIHWDDPAA